MPNKRVPLAQAFAQGRLEEGHKEKKPSTNYIWLIRRRISTEHLNFIIPGYEALAFPKLKSCRDNSQAARHS